ncbi:MAG: hypothetical protein WCI79_02020 [Candidatus Saccharibacteria bacterium]
MKKILKKPRHWQLNPVDMVTKTRQLYGANPDWGMPNDVAIPRPPEGLILSESQILLPVGCLPDTEDACGFNRTIETYIDLVANMPVFKDSVLVWEELRKNLRDIKLAPYGTSFIPGTVDWYVLDMDQYADKAPIEIFTDFALGNINGNLAHIHVLMALWFYPWLAKKWHQPGPFGKSPFLSGLVLKCNPYKNDEKKTKTNYSVFVDFHEGVLEIGLTRSTHKPSSTGGSPTAIKINA